MRITEARKRATATGRHGYFRASATEMYARCPECRVNVTTTVFAWASESEKSKARKQSMIEHLMEEH